MHDYAPDMPGLLQKLSDYVNDNDLAEINTIVADIQKRIERFKGQS